MLPPDENAKLEYELNQFITAHTLANITFPSGWFIGFVFGLAYTHRYALETYQHAISFVERKERYTRAIRLSSIERFKYLYGIS